MTGLRVGIVGTGASGVQVIQEAARVAADVVVFQRTPILALPMQQRPWTRENRTRPSRLSRPVPRRAQTPAGFDYDSCGESASPCPTKSGGRPTNGCAAEVSASGRQLRRIIRDENANRTAYDFWRDKVRARIHDRGSPRCWRDRTAPPFGTKRPSLEQTYYDVFNQDNVSLVDLKSTPIERITARAVRTSEREYPWTCSCSQRDSMRSPAALPASTFARGRTHAQGAMDRPRPTHLGLASADFRISSTSTGRKAVGVLQRTDLCRSARRARGEPARGPSPKRNHTHRSDGRGRRRMEALVKTIGDMTLFAKADSWYMGANIPGKASRAAELPGPADLPRGLPGSVRERLPRICAGRRVT